MRREGGLHGQFRFLQAMIWNSDLAWAAGAKGVPQFYWPLNNISFVPLILKSACCARWLLEAANVSVCDCEYVLAQEVRQEVQWGPLSIGAPKSQHKGQWSVPCV